MGGAWGFRRIVPELVQSGYQAVVIEPFDPTDPSLSQAPTLTAITDRWAATLAQLGVDQATIVAHAQAASIALRLAARHPDLARAVISLEGGMNERIVTNGLRTASAFAPFARVFGGSMIRKRIASSLRERSADPRWVTSDVVDTYARPLARDPSRAIRVMRCLEDAHEPESLAERARDIQVPVVLLLGEISQPSRPSDDDVARMRASLPTLEVETVVNAGHFLHEEQPGAVVGWILRMAAETSRPIAGRTASR
jgi:pimeloyl-ACP methyl ester carboxylesterase